MTTKTFRITGMHCTACAMNIDGELEDTPGVKEASTNYASAETKIIYDEGRVLPGVLIAAIKRAGYDAQLL